MKILKLNNKLFLFCLIPLLTIIYTGCGVSETELEARVVVRVGISFEDLDDNAKIEVEAGAFLDHFVSFSYREGTKRINATEVTWKTTLKDDPTAPLDSKIKITTTDSYYEVDVEKLTITEPIQLLVTADKGDNKTISKIITVKPKS